MDIELSHQTAMDPAETAGKSREKPISPSLAKVLLRYIKLIVFGLCMVLWGMALQRCTGEPVDIFMGPY
jgi:hypothetical protein